MSWATCESCYEDIHNLDFQNKLDAPKPWIGMYIAAASAICGIAMAVDVFNGFKTKQIWFPCKYFSLNAAILTLLAVQMKLTMDLTSTKLSGNDICAGYSSVVFMSSAMGNFMTSLASMENNQIMLNLIALGILLITVATNVWIFDIQFDKNFVGGGPYFDDYVSGFVLLLLIFLCNLAIVAPTVKRHVETKFSEMHKNVLREEEVRGGKYTAQELTVLLKKYWVMAVTGNPQFVMARSVICVIPNAACLSITLALFEKIHAEMNEYDDFFHSYSVYKWSINWIFIIQTAGAVIGTVAPTSRLFLAARFRSSRAGLKSFKEEMKTETYWTQRLIDWRESPIPLPIRHVKSKKVIHISKKMFLNICIIIQIATVLTSKLILIVFSWFLNVTFKFVYNVNKLRRHIFKFTSDGRGYEARVAGKNDYDFSPYVVLLEGELELPKGITANISNEADKSIQDGKKQKPKTIIELLQKSENFNGVSDFDRKNITNLHVQQPCNCWSLSVVTLTSIAVVLPNIPSNDVNKLFSGVNEGLPFVDFIEKKLDTSEEMRRIKKTADSIWVRLEFNKGKDQDVVQGNNMNDQTYKEKLLELSNKANKTVMEFKNKVTDLVMDNPLNWPIEVIAANSMYRVCESLLLIEIDGTEDQLDQKFFERLTIIISDILAACLTNLAHVIFTECHIISVEKRQESIRRALILMGESEEIIQYLEQREWPNLNNSYGRAIIELENENPV